jgi:energy-coupling factor transporter ATP-binding protein EcfA2
MRIREIIFRDFRSFRGERRISFINPLTDKVRPLTVLAGSNGSGKTTALDAIEALLSLLVDPHNPPKMVEEVLWWGASISLTVEFYPDDIPRSIRAEGSFEEGKGTATIQVGKAGSFTDRNEYDFESFGFGNGKGSLIIQSHPLKARRLLNAIAKFDKAQGDIAPRGGLLYFPPDRRLAVTRGGPIEPPPEEQPWLFHFSSPDGWQGSLEQLWVWQNYLDLEQNSKGRRHLMPFVEAVEKILGEERRIHIDQGRALVPVSWGKGMTRPDVNLDQLPSGEQQVLLLFGEMARRRREGAVIMIDEIENSLHPTLQRLVMWNLRRITREWDAQVIVATHSLEVINTVRGGAFINLDYPEDRFDLPIPDQSSDEGSRS